MLTADLVRVAYHRDNVRPFYVDPGDPDLLDLASSLIRIFDDHRGKSRGELEAELEEFLGTGTEFLLHRGLAKLLLDRCEFSTVASIEPPELRRAVFEKAAETYRKKARGGFDRSVVLGDLATRFARDPGELERNLFADLKDEQILETLKGLTPDGLLKRYNVALAQGVLLRATGLKIEIRERTPGRYRELFRTIKFFQLLHTVEGDARNGYRIYLNGPLSLFRSSQRYGVQMANFLPTLLRFDRWTLEASLLWGRQRARRRFRLTAADGLESHRDLRGQWQPEEIGWLPARFSRLKSDWTISTETELLDLQGRGVLVPDYVFVHGPTGRRVYMEIFGFWRRGALGSRLELLRRYGPGNLIVALSRDLRADEEATEDLPGEVYIFRNQPIAREVLALLERFRDGPRQGAT